MHWAEALLYCLGELYASFAAHFVLVFSQPLGGMETHEGILEMLEQAERCFSRHHYVGKRFIRVKHVRADTQSHTLSSLDLSWYYCNY